MASLADVSEWIKRIDAERKHGRLYFYYAAPKSGVMSFAYIVFDGSADCFLQCNKISHEQLVEELAGKDIVKINFMPLAGAVTDSGIRFSIADLVGIFEQISQSELSKLPEPEDSKTDLLTGKKESQQRLPQLRNPSKVVEEILAHLQMFYGGGASNQLDRAMLKYPPHLRPVEFLDECRNLLDSMVGRKKSMQFLQKFYDEVFKD